MEAALESGIPIAGVAPVVFRELALPTGFPDIVAVLLSRHELLFNEERLTLGSDHLRLLHHLHAAKRASIDSLVGTLVWSEREIERLLNELTRAELVRRMGKEARCAPLAEVFVAKRIVAIEAKIRDWRTAIRQAMANTWFASHSYILIPVGRWNGEVEAEAGRFGIGVLAHDGARTLVKLQARNRRIPASYGSWLVNEWAVRRAGRPCN